MRLHIITTGGAIDEVYFDARSDFQVGDPVIGNLLRDPGVAPQFRVESAMRTDAGFNIKGSRTRPSSLPGRCSPRPSSARMTSTSAVPSARCSACPRGSTWP